MKTIIDFFTISSREKKGTLILLSLIVIISAVIRFPSIFEEKMASYDYSSFENDILAAQPEMSGEKKEKLNFFPADQKKIKSKKETKFFFDPNTASIDELIQLGFFPSLAGRIENFRIKGGRFNVKSDLLKIYGMSESFYNSLSPWIKIEERKSEGKPGTTEALPSGLRSKVDLNSADSLSLLSLSGIGPVLASRILKYRDALGGFCSNSQLKEVYGIKEEVFNLLNERVISEGPVVQINLNSCNAEELKRHPYFKGRLPYIVVQYREKHGNYQSVEDIKKTDLVNDELYLKIAPYLTVE